MTAERLVILSGPSGVGKGPIVEWTKGLVQDLEQVYVYKTRTPRHATDPNSGLPKPVGEPTVMYCRGTRQEIYLDSIKEAIDKNRFVIIESYYSAHDMLKKEFEKDTEVKSVFITPISKYYTEYLSKYSANGLGQCVKEMMLDSLFRRAVAEDKKITKELFYDLDARADDAINEMRFARNYDLILVNEKHEYKPEWKAKEITGDYFKVVDSLADIVKFGHSSSATPGKDYVF